MKEFGQGTRRIIDGLHARRMGSTWMARCPAHEDHNPSLAIREGRDGSSLVHCHAGCRQSDVVSAIKSLGLWPEHKDPYKKSHRSIVATYDYTDEKGELLFQTVRYDPKNFKQRYPDGCGDWIWKKHPRQVLYHLPEVLEAAIVFVVEGEKDCEALRARGFVSTTNAMGALAPWLPSFSESLRGREVIIVPDNDKPGWERAEVIARALLGVAARIRILDLPKESKDISDWFAVGHSESELIGILEGVHAV